MTENPEAMYGPDGDTSGCVKRSDFEDMLNTTFLPFLGQRKKCIDVGGGNGRLSEILGVFFDGVVLLEPCCTPNPKFKRKNVRFVPSLFLDFVTDDRFDLILFWESLYMMSHRACIKHAESMLSDSGIIIIADDKKRHEGYATEEELKIIAVGDKNTYDINRLATEFSLCVIDYRIICDRLRVFTLKKRKGG